jgi:hypothetical protein
MRTPVQELEIKVEINGRFLGYLVGFEPDGELKTHNLLKI